MNFEIWRVLRPGSKTLYLYDFGSTTQLVLTVAAERMAVADGKNVQLLARNDLPSILCDSCDEQATLVCTQCLCDDAGCLCDECAEHHECEADFYLPVVNSPRVGTCAYAG